MAKNLSERLKVLASRNPEAIRRANLAVFLALKSEVETAMADGWSARACWEALHAEKRVTFSYQAFCRYVRKHLQPATAEQSTASTAPPAPQPAPAGTTPAPVAQPQRAPITPPVKGAGFDFKAAANKEDLL